MSIHHSTVDRVPDAPERPHAPYPEPGSASSFSARAIASALKLAVRKLDPRLMWRNPVMFIVLLGAVLLTGMAAASGWLGAEQAQLAPLTWALAAWLWATVIFANFADAMAEGRGKAQAESLKATRRDTLAEVVQDYDEAGDPGAVHARVDRVGSQQLAIGQVVRVRAGELVPGDGEIIHGITTVDESAITGESAPVLREAGTDHSAVTGGTRVLSDEILVRITTRPGASFVDRMIALVEGANRQKTPNEIALNLLLTGLGIVFLLVVLTLNPIASANGHTVSIPVLVALLVCLIPTTIGALLSAIGIAGMDRLVQRNVLATSGRAVEAAGDVSTLLLDKTGTITYGNRMATQVTALPGLEEQEVLLAAVRASQGDPTPEGKSVIELAARCGVAGQPDERALVVPFTAQTRMSGLDLADGTQIRKGAASAVEAWAVGQGYNPQDADAQFWRDAVSSIASAGATPLLLADSRPGQPARMLGVIALEDVIKDGLVERFEQLRAMGIRTVMVTGDNPLTAAAIARKAGVDDFLAEATPEEKLALIRREQDGGHLVAMTGDGTNDAPALAQADVGLAMNSGTAAAKEAGNMVDLDSDPTKLIDVVRIGKQLLITRGALTTFSIANDLAKYFAIIPAMFTVFYPGLGALNIMGLHSASSAILSAVIFNALVIIGLIPLALRGVRYRPMSPSRMLTRNLWIYGLGGVIAPFIGIKLIDLLISWLPGL
ncbi:potassium-transporting ATPase subunit KdpB [Glutamicibacter arilaitensis]|uniref:potassium-transporting ATPase subunit KdpB n=1 Tax=Glutamicibacter arilaitensis TaxID=256701 RepID=UPI003F8F2222